MKTIFLIRHAKSSWDYPSLSDFDRPLNKRGMQDAPTMAKLLKNKGFMPDHLVSSPAKRAWSTALYFANAYGIDPNQIEKEEAIYEASATTILNIIRKLNERWQTVFLFGHNPTFTDVVNLFSDRFILNIPTCGISMIDCGIDKWTDFDRTNSKLKATYFPKEV